MDADEMRAAGAGTADAAAAGGPGAPGAPGTATGVSEGHNLWHATQFVTPGEGEVLAFASEAQIARGDRATVARALREALDAGEQRTLLAFDAVTSEPVEFDLRGTPDEVEARARAAQGASSVSVPTPAPEAAAPTAPRGPGRPRLGVVAREVTLLPRHWEWLAAQPGGASAALRRLVERARKEGAGADRRRAALESTFRFANAMAGDRPGFEEAVRALYAGDLARFDSLAAAWPPDIAAHAIELAGRSFPGPEGTD